VIRCDPLYWEREKHHMSFAAIAKVLTPLVIGGALGTVSLLGLVYSQTQAPSNNPADQQVLVYGDR